MPFQVVCACGQSVRGERRRQHQVIACPGCGQSLFVLPRSPWTAGGAEASAGSAAKGHAPRGVWRWVMGAGVAALGVMMALFLMLRPYLAREQHSPAAQSEQSTAYVREQMESGRQALADGNFRVALRRLGEAVRLRERQPDLLPPPEHRDLAQLHRQAELLANLSSLSLQELLHQGLRQRDEEEWQAQFTDHRGRAVLFDDVVGVVSREGRPTLTNYSVSAKGVAARVAIEDLTLWRRVPLDQPRRLLFGARLSRIGREEGGVWVVRFQPDSGVLLTDPGAAAACCPAPLDPELLQVLHRQQEYLQP